MIDPRGGEKRSSNIYSQTRSRTDSSIVLVPVDLIRHHHHPEQKHRAHDLERERGLPRLADAVGLQPGQGRFALARAGPDQVAVAADALLGAVEQDRRLDQAGEPEHEEDEGAQYDDPWQEQALRNQDDHGEEEDEREGRRGDFVREDPICRILVD